MRAPAHHCSCSSPSLSPPAAASRCNRNGHRRASSSHYYRGGGGNESRSSLGSTPIFPAFFLCVDRAFSFPIPIPLPLPLKLALTFPLALALPFSLEMQRLSVQRLSVLSLRPHLSLSCEQVKRVGVR